MAEAYFKHAKRRRFEDEDGTDRDTGVDCFVTAMLHANEYAYIDIPRALLIELIINDARAVLYLLRVTFEVAT